MKTIRSFGIDKTDMAQPCLFSREKKVEKEAVTVSEAIECIVLDMIKVTHGHNLKRNPLLLPLSPPARPSSFPRILVASAVNCSAPAGKIAAARAAEKRALDDCLELFSETRDELKKVLADLATTASSSKHYVDLQRSSAPPMTNQAIRASDGFATARTRAPHHRRSGLVPNLPSREQRPCHAQKIKRKKLQTLISDEIFPGIRRSQRRVPQVAQEKTGASASSASPKQNLISQPELIFEYVEVPDRKNATSGGAEERSRPVGLLQQQLRCVPGTLSTSLPPQFYAIATVYGTWTCIFGNAAVVFQNCNLYAGKNHGTIQKTSSPRKGRRIQPKPPHFDPFIAKVGGGRRFNPGAVRRSKNYLGRREGVFLGRLFIVFRNLGSFD
nr:pectinesterase-like [Ipomoea batatas]